jgi:hypothetical protein
MNNKSFQPIFLFFLIFINAETFAQDRNVLPSWAFGGFARPKGVNPVISPDSSATFLDPMTNLKTHWEANDTFNPAAVIKNGKIVVLYRSEDKSGVKISTRTFILPAKLNPYFILITMTKRNTSGPEAVKTLA